MDSLKNFEHNFDNTEPFYHQVLCRQLLVNINCLAKPALSSLHHDDFVGTWQGLYDFLMSPFAYVLTGLFGSRLL